MYSSLHVVAVAGQLSGGK